MVNEFLGCTASNAWDRVATTKEDGFDLRQAAHLVRRFGFGASYSELKALRDLGKESAIQSLLQAPATRDEFAKDMSSLRQTLSLSRDIEPAAAWWLYRMRFTPWQTEEKLTLFWHGHFATSGQKVQDARLMLRQNEILRTDSLGSFTIMLQSMAKDPAMLLYLDSATNRKTHPNENFAREVMELFSLGVDQYSEKDIQELAKCFTGWEVQHGEFKFNSYQHDSSRKRLFGKSGNWDGDAAIEVILKQPQAARFLSGKLARYLIADAMPLEEEWIEPLANCFRENDYQIRPVLEMIAHSRLFAASNGQKIRSPVEGSIGLLRSFEATANLQTLVPELRELGQLPMFPPNVKGWNGGREWINASTLLGRVNLFHKLLSSNEASFGGSSLAEYFSANGWKPTQETLEALFALLLPSDPSVEIRDKILEYWMTDQGDANRAVRRVVSSIAALPEFQLS